MSVEQGKAFHGLRPGAEPGGEQKGRAQGEGGVCPVPTVSHCPAQGQAHRQDHGN